MATRNSNELQQAVAILIQNQAHFLATQARTDERFSRIENKLDAIERILLRHDRILADLPEAIRQKVGFKPGR